MSRSRAGGLLFGTAWLLVSILGAALGLPLIETLSEGSGPIPIWIRPNNASSWWFLLGAGIIWLNGLLDDFHQLPARYRIVMQALGVAAGILGPEEFRSSINPFLLILIWIGLVYYINVFNFMDGTDGLAASEGIFLVVAVFLLGFGGLAFQLLAIAVTIFLFWNLPRARMFMGDAGSNLLGYVTGIALLQVFMSSPNLAFLLPVAFTVDTTLTLLLRMARGQPFYVAHKEHAYQHLAGRFGHSIVLVLYSFFNLMILVMGIWINTLTGVFVTGLVVVLHILALIVFYIAGAGRPRSDF
ncbi:MAG: hypothetical protein RH862_14920 [Leptospiraceae bacterium]